jgi:hypothetical protein
MTRKAHAMRTGTKFLIHLKLYIPVLTVAKGIEPSSGKARRRAEVINRAILVAVFAVLFSCPNSFGEGPCLQANAKLACVIPQEYGANKPFTFSTSGNGVFLVKPHAGIFDDSILNSLRPLTANIGRQANLLPLASPSSGVLLSFDQSLKTFVVNTDSLGPILGERAETVGRHHLFVGFSYQFFDFDKIDSVNLHDFPIVLTHADDSEDTPGVTCSIHTDQNIGSCAFVRDLVSTRNSIDLKVNRYTTYLTFGISRSIDLSMVIPVENVRMQVTSQDTVVLGSNTVIDHLWRDCGNTTDPTSDPKCFHHVFPDPVITTDGSKPGNAVSGIGDVVARVKWNAWHGERAGVAAGLEVRFPTGDELNYLGSGSYGMKPFAIFSYRARVSPHVSVGYEWNGDSIAAGDLSTGTKASVPNDFVYSAGADAWITRWLTGSFDLIGQRIFATRTVINSDIFGTRTLSVIPTQFLAPCGECSAPPNPNTVARSALQLSSNTNSYNITNASMGIKIRPLGKVSKLVITANILVRLDQGGLSYRPSPLVGIGYTF